MAASATAIEEFLSGPLVAWLATCVRKPETLQVYETFFDGAPITEVLLQIDPEPLQPVPSLSNLQGVNITFARIKIFHCIIRNIKNIYEVTQSPPKMHNKAEKFTERKTFGVMVTPSVLTFCVKANCPDGIV
jgi:hypothetical protein